MLAHCMFYLSKTRYSTPGTITEVGTVEYVQVQHMVPNVNHAPMVFPATLKSCHSKIHIYSIINCYLNCYAIAREGKTYQGFSLHSIRMVQSWSPHESSKETRLAPRKMGHLAC